MDNDLTKKIRLGNTVKIRFKNGEIRSFTLVNSWQADPFNDLVSNVCPIGKAVVGATVGEKRKYTVNGREIEIEILEVLKKNK